MFYLHYPKRLVHLTINKDIMFPEYWSGLGLETETCRTLVRRSTRQANMLTVHVR